MAVPQLSRKKQNYARKSKFGFYEAAKTHG